MAPSTEYHKRSHSRSEVLRFSCSLKNAGSVYYRRDRPTIWTTAFLKMTQEVFVRGPSVGCLVPENEVDGPTIIIEVSKALGVS